jgi:hypothetical protein
LGLYLKTTGAFPLLRSVIWFVPPIASAHYLDTTTGTESQGEIEADGQRRRIGGKG